MKKPGYRTTEFWLSLAAVLVGALMASGALDTMAPDHWLVKVVAVIATVLGALGYTATRGLVKAGEVKAAALMAVADPTKPPQD